MFDVNRLQQKSEFFNYNIEEFYLNFQLNHEKLVFKPTENVLI